MNETKHTPGTWYEAKMGNDHQGLVVDEQTGANVAVAYDKANARLIAAAPDLLAVLETILERLGTCPMQDDELAQVLRAAIAKSKGE